MAKSNGKMIWQWSHTFHIVQVILTEIAIPLPLCLECSDCRIALPSWQWCNFNSLCVAFTKKVLEQKKNMLKVAGLVTSTPGTWVISSAGCFWKLFAQCPESGKDHLRASLAPQQSIYSERLSGSKLSCCLSLICISIQYSPVSWVVRRETVMSKFKDEIYFKKKKQQQHHHYFGRR